MTAPILETMIEVKEETQKNSRIPVEVSKSATPYFGNEDFLKLIADDIRKRIMDENPNAHTEKKYIQKIRCPVCEEHESWTYYEKPLAIICQRANKCGSITPVKTLYPECFLSLAERFPSTPIDPNATARAYLHSRGLDTSKIQYTQGEVEDKESRKKYQTLKIKVDSGTTFHRLIDYKGKDKVRIFGSYSGKVWKPETLDFTKEIWVVEGILDALSLIQEGIQSVATLSSAHLPDEFYEASKIRQPKFVLAFDDDEAGRKAVEKHILYFDEKNKKDNEKVFIYRIAIPPKGKDWNDLLVENSLNETNIKDCYWRGCLFQADNSDEYFRIYCEKHGTLPTIFEFKNQLYKGFFTEKKDETIPQTFRLADCTINILYSIEDDSILYQSKTKHRLELHSYREGKNIVEFSSEELSQLTHFKTVLAHYRQVFKGSSYDLTNIMEYLFSQTSPKIRQCKALGYDRKSKCFVFPKFLYDKDGKRFETNAEGYFEKQKIAPFSEKIIGEIKEINIPEFLETLSHAYSNRGLMALGFWVSSLFSHTIFDRFGFFPFLSMYGDSRCGKSDLTKMLNRCFFVDWEGISMTRANTQKGEIRKISQKSSLVTPMLEGRKDKTRFDYDSVLPAYNRNSTQIRAKTTNDNETYEIPFEGTLAFIQNQEQFTSKAAKERVISLQFLGKDLTDESYQAWQKLGEYSPEQLAFVGHSVLKERKWFEERVIALVEETSRILNDKGVKVDRIAKNHAIALAGSLLICQKFGYEKQSEELKTYAVIIAKQKIESARTENSLADLFFDSMFSLPFDEDMGTESLGYLRKDDQIVLHLPTVLIKLNENSSGSWNRKELTEALNELSPEKKETREFGGKVRSCWIFKNIKKVEN
ncbi:MAG: toprim domain-containing protein [Planctomycetota bacterium]